MFTTQIWYEYHIICDPGSELLILRRVQNASFTMMIPGIIIKIAYTATVWLWIFPAFSETKGRAALAVKMIGLLFVCIAAEVFLSVATSDHRLSHQFSHAPTIWINIVVYLLISCVLLGIYFTKRLIESERKQRELAETKLVTELAYLRSQIHPHFLFNTLNNIFSIAQRDQKDELADSISKLSGMLRYLLYESGSSRVSLQKEIEHLRDFIGLATMRYSPDEILLTFDVTGDTGEAVIAPMILLPFVENAFKHGVTIGKKNEIRISIDVRDGKIIFHCVNEKRTSPSNTGSSGVGLANVSRRIELLYPSGHELVIEDSDKFYDVRLMLT